MMLIPYVSKKSKCLVLLCTRNPNDTIDESDLQKKPEIINFYNSGKGPAAIVDELPS